MPKLALDGLSESLWAGHAGGPGRTVLRPSALHKDSGLEPDLASGSVPALLGAAADRITNDGVISGDVRTGDGDDLVVNRGTITGDVDLGAGNDRYDGTLGKVGGVVNGGLGDDVILGGSAGETLLGGQGDDRIEGGGGDDVIEGGPGADFIDGGDGHDLLSFIDSLTAVTVDLAAGTADDGLSPDRFTRMEGVIGSIFDDHLVGSADADEILGNDGADVINGGAGDDLIVGGQGDDDLTGGSGADRFIHSVSDGNDIIRDLGPEDAIAVAGYAAAQSMTRQGDDVLVTLAAGDSLLVKHSDVAFILSHMTFDPLPRAPLAGPVVEPIQATVDQFIPAGVTLTSLNPASSQPNGLGITDTAMILAGATLFNAGTIDLYSAGDDGDAKALTPPDLAVASLVNLPGGLISVHSQTDGWGGLRLADVFNFGLIDVTADWSAGGIVESGGNDAAGAHSIVNAGTIRVVGGDISVGIGSLFDPTRPSGSIFNSGTVDVRGASGSAGIIFSAAGSPAALVNSGTIRVVDADGNGDAIGMVVDWRAPTVIWNSGSITADLALVLLSGATAAASAGVQRLTLYNNGELHGSILAQILPDPTQDRHALSLINRGTIAGDILLGPNDDLFDGRLGQLAGTVSGGDGRDVLLAGAGGQTLAGGYGDDFLSGGAGDDVLTGGEGADRFRFEPGFGRDTITDFNPAEGDRIEVRGFGGWSALVQNGSDVEAVFAPGDVLVLRATQVADIRADFFTFNAPAIAAAVEQSAPLPPAMPAFHAAGSPFADVLLGQAGADILSGSGGDDILSGGPGADVLSGGAGRDLFRDTLAGHAGDTVTDFSFGDRLQFTDARPDSFPFALSGRTLTYSGGSLSFTTALPGTLVASPAAGGGVQLVLAAASAGARLFNPSGIPVVGNFNPAFGWSSQTLFPRHAADLNGDGKADIVGFGIAGVYAALSTAGGSLGPPSLVLANFGKPSGWTDDNRYHRAVADLDRDGRADIIGFGYAGTWVSLAGPDGSFGEVSLNLANFGVAQGWNSQDAFTRLIGDVNGDGKADIVGFGYAGTWVALGTGDGTFGPAQFGLAGFGVNQGWTSDVLFHRELADVNGDGSADIVGFGFAGTYVALANGDGTFASPRLTLANFGTLQGWTNNDRLTRLVTDVNGDHLADIVAFAAGGTVVALGRGDGSFGPLRSDVADFGPAQGWVSDDRYHREFADVDGDGFVDLVGFGIFGVLVGHNALDGVF